RESLRHAPPDSLGGARHHGHSRRSAHERERTSISPGIEASPPEGQNVGSPGRPKWTTTTAPKARRNGPTGPPTATASSTSPAPPGGSVSCFSLLFGAFLLGVFWFSFHGGLPW